VLGAMSPPNSTSFEAHGQRDRRACLGRPIPGLSVGVRAIDRAVDNLLWFSLLGGLFGSTVLAIPSAAGHLDRRRSPFVVMGGLLVAVGVGLVLYAAGDDRYFSSGSVTRWDFAARDGGEGFVVGALVLGLTVLVLMVAAARRPSSRGWRRWSMCAATLAFIAFFPAVFVLTVGH
jgi:hypothetical protein